MARRVSLPRGRSIWLHVAFLAVVANVIPWALVAWAQRGVTSALTAVLYSLIPLMTLLISAALSVEILTFRRIAGMITASIGTLVIVGFEPTLSQSAVPVFAVLVACSLLASGAVYAKRFVTARVAALPMVTLQLAMAFLVSAPLALLFDGAPRWEQLTPAVLGASLTLGAVGTGLAFLMYYILIENIGATNTMMISYVIPIIGVVAGGVILSEPITASLLTGGAAIVAGVWLSQGARQPLIGGLDG